MTYEEILARMLARVPDTMDKREGSLIYDALAPAAVELRQMYASLEANASEGFADTATRPYLIKRAAERGLKPRPATKAIVKVKATPALDIPIGARFSLDEINYSMTEKIDGQHYKLECDAPGSIGNLSSGDLVPIEYIEGLTKMEIIQLLIPADDEEETEIFRKRYFDSFQSQAFSGNIADYKARVDSLPGVGGVKVYPAKNGAGTVGLVIVNSDYDVPSTSLIEQVQNEVDPPESAGKGTGLAPIGHVVTVSGVTAAPVNIATTITYASGWNFSEAKALIESAIDGYFKELAEAWADEPFLVARIAQIETRILNLEGVIDIGGTTLNGSAQNLQLGADSIPRRGTVSG